MKRRVFWVALGLFLGALVAPPVVSYGQLGCWGSICQTAQGQIILSGSVTPTQPIALSTAPGVLSQLGDLTLACQPQASGPAFGPGVPGATTLRVKTGSAPGTTKLVVINGTSQQEITLIDNIPGGSCG